MDGWKGGWVDGWTDRWTGRWKKGRRNKVRQTSSKYTGAHPDMWTATEWF